MIFGLLFEVFAKAFLLLMLIYIVARDEADFDFRKITMVTAALTLGAVVLDAVLTQFIGAFTLIPIAALAAFMVMKFCWVRFWRSLLIVIPFLAINIMISSSIGSFHKKADAALTRGLQGPISEEDMKIALSMYQDGARSNKLLEAMQRKPPEVQATADQIIVKKLMCMLLSGKTTFKKPVEFKIKPGPPPSGPASPAAAAPAAAVPPEQKSAHQAAEKPAGQEEWQEAEKLIRLKGVMIGSDGVRVAMVNNQMVREGELIQVEHKKRLYRWRAGSIRENKISWEKVDEIVR
ncbi:MAG: hypothetical protein WC299_08855 [Kiritimatiellia bacterium]